MIRWRGRDLKPKERVANARDDFVNLTPVSEIPALTTRANWAATLPGQTVPLIWEDSRYGYREEEDERF